MKLFGRVISYSLALSVTAGALLFSACGGQPDLGGGEDVETGYTVSAECDSSRGSVLLSAPAAGSKYDAGEEVTVTLVPAESFVAGGIVVNGVVAEDAVDEYTFTVEGDAVVYGAFFEDPSSLPDVQGLPVGAAKFALLFRGHWKSEEGTELYIGETKLSYGGEAIGRVTASGSDAEQAYNFDTDGGQVSLSWADYTYTWGGMLCALDPSDGSREFFLRDPSSAVTIDPTYSGEWVNGESTLSIGDGIVFNGKKVATVFDCGYYEASEGGYSAPIRANVYAFAAEGSLHLLIWSPEDHVPTVNGNFYRAKSEGGESYTFPDMYHGTWESEEGTVVITETALSVDGEPIPATANGDTMFTFTWKGKSYDAGLYADSSYVLEFRHEVYAEGGENAGLLEGYELVFFVKTDRPAVTVDPSLDGTWTDPLGSADDVVIADGAIVWGEDTAIVIEAGETRADGFTYYVLLRGDVCTLSMLDYGADPAQPEWHLDIVGNKAACDFVRAA